MQGLQPIPQIRSTLSQNLSQHQHSDARSSLSFQEKEEQANINTENILLQVLKTFQKDKPQSQKDKTSQRKSVYSLIPEPLSSDQEQSQEAQYLSYLESTLQARNPKQVQAASKRQNLDRASRREFLSVLYQCIIYVRKAHLRTPIDDDLLAERMSAFLSLSVNPQALNPVGEAMLANGYCLVAYAIAIARTNQSPLLIEFIFRQFQAKGELEDNQEEFAYYCAQPPDYFGVQQKYIQKSLSLEQSNLKRRSITYETLQKSCQQQTHKNYEHPGQTQRQKQKTNFMRSTKHTTTMQTRQFQNAAINTISHSSPEC